MTHTPERRTEDRQRVLKGGKVFYNNFAISLDCVIRNESSHGMQITLDPTCALPNEFSLLNRKEGTLADAKVIWKNGDKMGIEFCSKMQDVRTFAKADIRRMSIIATRG
ncbi:PilZ domain-containing protein [Cohaesibacter intestini]|uniref:PilZ domain-containing protein n=1 Tax=Cohaesibacter intestini TaxID=2211145 RepID=UPI000DEA14EB|nr:PilZ domain-containing protein [Cohaesibacter intestini]